MKYVLATLTVLLLFMSSTIANAALENLEGRRYKITEGKVKWTQNANVRSIRITCSSGTHHIQKIVPGNRDEWWTGKLRRREAYDCRVETTIFDRRVGTVKNVQNVQMPPAPGHFPSAPPPPSPIGPTTNSELKVALIGDTDSKENFRTALKIARTGGANVIMINGDFVYLNDDEPKRAFFSKAQTWKQILQEEIDLNRTAVIGSLGNHDVDFNDNNGTAWEDEFIKYFDSFRNSYNGLRRKCTGAPGLSKMRDVTLVNEVCTFGNVSIVASSINLFHEHGFSSQFFEDELHKKLSAAPASNWKLAGYHFTLASMNRAGKSEDQNTHRFFDIIRQHGAIGAQAHTHQVMASCSISSPFRLGEAVRCDRQFGNDSSNRWVGPGLGLYVDSSAVRDVRPKTSCLNAGAGCKHMTDVITAEGYSYQDRGSRSLRDGRGVLFLVFNANGDSSKGYATYMNFSGDQVFSFNIHKM